jgi:glycine dehydrogenase subunit 1
VIQNPNYLGRIEPVEQLASAARYNGAQIVATVNPVSLSVLKPPGEYGAAIAVGEAQPFGVYPSFGGPLLGFLAAQDRLKRRLPGRVVGRARDRHGRQGYVLTLQTREQHIRREKATSNVCTNVGLNAVRAAIYLALLGKEGFQELGQANLVRCQALQQALRQIPGVEFPFAGPVFNEFVIRLPRSAYEFRAFAAKHRYLVGVPLAGFAECGEGDMLVAVTEKRTAAEINRYGELLNAFLHGGPEVSA